MLKQLVSQMTWESPPNIVALLNKLNSFFQGLNFFMTLWKKQ